MDLKKAREFIKNIKWVFAKSYSKTFPHEYTTRDRTNDDMLFESFIYYARENSTIKSFFSKQYLYYELDGYEYWEMGRPVKAVQVLNKAPIDDNKHYRYPVPPNGSKEMLLNKLKERDLYVQTLLDIKDKTEKQRGILKFFLNSERKSPNIIDHSNK